MGAFEIIAGQREPANLNAKDYVELANRLFELPDEYRAGYDAQAVPNAA